MNIGISTRCFGTTRLAPELLERLRRAEFVNIELHGTLPGFDYTSRSQMRDIARWFVENELPAPFLHLPFAVPGEDILSPRPIERQRALDTIKRCIEFGDLLPLNFAILHLGEAGQSFHPVMFDHAYAAIATIQSFAGARVLLETLSNDIATFDRILEFKTVSQIQSVGICYDTGHGEMNGQADAVHLDDNGGDGDNHLWPLAGKRNWPALVESLLLSSFDGPMTLEGQDDRIDQASESRSRLRDMIDEARNSIEEFRLKYMLPAPQEVEE